MDNVDVFNNSAIILNKKVPKRIISWITILIILLSLVTIILFVNFNVYKSTIGIYHNDKVEIYDFNLPLNKKNKLYINQNLYNYKIIGIYDNKIILDIKLDDDLKIENNIFNINILKSRTNLFNIIKKKWKEVFFK